MEILFQSSCAVFLFISEDEQNSFANVVFTLHSLFLSGYYTSKSRTTGDGASSSSSRQLIDWLMPSIPWWIKSGCSIHHVPDVLVCLILSTNIGIAVATFQFLIPVYAYDLFGREYKLQLDGILAAQFASGCLYQYVMSEYRIYSARYPFNFKVSSYETYFIGQPQKPSNEEKWNYTHPLLRSNNNWFKFKPLNWIQISGRRMRLLLW